MKCFVPSGGGPEGTTAIGSVLKVRTDGSAPLEAACDGCMPLSPLVEFGTTIGVIEFGTIEDPGVDACATAVGGAAAGETVAGRAAVKGAAVVTAPAESADATLTGPALAITNPQAPMVRAISLP
jgi:hypothetical protein